MHMFLTYPSWVCVFRCHLTPQVLGASDSLPPVYTELEVNFFLLRRLLGVRTQSGEKQGKVSKLQKSEVLMLNIGSMCTGAKVNAVKSDLAKLQLTSPVCTRIGEKVALSRRVEKHWRLIGTSKPLQCIFGHAVSSSSSFAE